MGELVVVFEKFGELVSSVGWLLDGRIFIIGFFDKVKLLCEWDLFGSLFYNWIRWYRIEDLVVLVNGEWLVVMDDRCGVYIYYIFCWEYEVDLILESRFISVSLS